MVLFDPRVHEPLHDAAWSPVAAEAAIVAIAHQAAAQCGSPVPADREGNACSL